MGLWSPPTLVLVIELTIVTGILSAQSDSKIIDNSISRRTFSWLFSPRPRPPPPPPPPKYYSNSGENYNNYNYNMDGYGLSTGFWVYELGNFIVTLLIEFAKLTATSPPPSWSMNNPPDDSDEGPYQTEFNDYGPNGVDYGNSNNDYQNW